MDEQQRQKLALDNADAAIGELLKEIYKLELPSSRRADLADGAWRIREALLLAWGEQW